jgi:hypothetical protein
MAAPTQTDYAHRFSIRKKLGNCRVKERELAALIADVSNVLTTEFGLDPHITWTHQYRRYPRLKQPYGEQATTKWFKVSIDRQVAADSFEALLQEMVSLNIISGKARRIYHVRIEIVAGEYKIQLEIGSPRLPSEGPSHSARLELTGPDDRLSPVAFIILKYLQKPWERAFRRFAFVSTLTLTLLTSPFAALGSYIDSRLAHGAAQSTVWEEVARVSTGGLFLGAIPFILLIQTWRLSTAACVLLGYPRGDSPNQSRSSKIHALFDLIIPKRWRKLEIAAFAVAALAAIFQLLSWLFPLK